MRWGLNLEKQMDAQLASHLVQQWVILLEVVMVGRLVGKLDDKSHQATKLVQ